jgi:hypothetical protein
MPVGGARVEQASDQPLSLVSRKLGDRIHNADDDLRLRRQVGARIATEETVPGVVVDAAAQVADAQRTAAADQCGHEPPRFPPRCC